MLFIFLIYLFLIYFLFGVLHPRSSPGSAGCLKKATETPNAGHPILCTCFCFYKDLLLCKRPCF
jgi:hypothetical protein